MIAKSEITFFNSIKHLCHVIFDIGCREDIVYIVSSENKIFHLFEPNPVFFQNIMLKLEEEGITGDNIVIVNNFGLGKENGVFTYYKESQSFFRRDMHYNHKEEPLSLEIKRFTDYLSQEKITKIDFLKIDTEGYEADILLDNVGFIKERVRFIQFEYASTWMDRNIGIELIDIFGEYKDEFMFYFLYDENHPISKFCPKNLTEIKDETDVETVTKFVKNQFGFNIVMIKRTNL